VHAVQDATVIVLVMSLQAAQVPVPESQVWKPAAHTPVVQLTSSAPVQAEQDATDVSPDMSLQAVQHAA